MVKGTGICPYAAWLRKRLQTLYAKTTLAELKTAYEIETGNKITLRGARATFRRLAGSHAVRHEQLYWYPIESKGTSDYGKVHKGTSQPIHSSHRYRFSISYSGQQPKDGIIRPWGRNRKQLQVEYKLGQDMRLQVFSKRIIVMLANPKGTTTREQLIEARKLAYLSILGFAKERNLALGEDFEKKLGTHHVLEPEELNRPFKGLGPYAKEIEARTGSLVLGDGSHEGMEHQGGGTSRTKGELAAENFEWLLWQFRGEFSEDRHTREEYLGAIRAYTEQIKLHLEVEQRTLHTLERIGEAMERLGR